MVIYTSLCIAGGWNVCIKLVSSGLGYNRYVIPTVLVFNGIKINILTL